MDSGVGSIETREAALDALCQVGVNGSRIKELLIHVPTDVPQSDEGRQQDPFSVYGVCGNVFPDGAGDSYFGLCLKAKPDHAAEIRRLFDGESEPGFDVIDAIGQGTGWPPFSLCSKLSQRRKSSWDSWPPPAPSRPH